MKEKQTRRKLMIAGAVATAAFTAAGSAVSAQTATTTSPTATSRPAGVLATSVDAATRAPRATSTSQMIQEACQRSKARAAKFLRNGTPEEWGSEEPFTFDPKTPC